MVETGAHTLAQLTLIEFVIQFLHVFLAAIQQQEIQFSLVYVMKTGVGSHSLLTFVGCAHTHTKFGPAQVTYTEPTHEQFYFIYD